MADRPEHLGWIPPSERVTMGQDWGGTATPPAPWHSMAPGSAYTLAGWWRRAGAAFIDGMLVGIVALVAAVLLSAGLAEPGTEDHLVSRLAVAALAFTVFALVGLFYAPLMLWRTGGRTVGRMIVGTRVVRATGEPLTLGTAVLREVVLKGLVFGALGSATGGIALLANYLWPLWDGQSRALHDFPVDTRTVLG